MDPSTLEKQERRRLTALYQEHVCPTTCPVVLRMMRLPELRRLVFVGMYAAQYTVYSKRGRVIARLRKLTGIGRTKAWACARDYELTRKQPLQ